MENQLNFENSGLNLQNLQNQLLSSRETIFLLEEKIKVLTSLIANTEQNNQKFDRFFRNDLTGNFICDEKGNILDCNNAFLDIYGFNEKTEIVGKNIASLYKNKAEFSKLKERLKQEGIIKNIEGERIRKDGKHINVLVNLITDYDSKANSNLIIGFIFDITERKMLELELIKAKEKAQESDRLKSAFLANMSHEIRTPMNAIFGFASLLKNQSNTEEDISKFSEIIINSSNHLLRLINDIIDISRIEANELKMIYSEVNLDLILMEIFMFFQSQLVAKNSLNINLQYEVAQKNLIVVTDETRLRQILVNLIGNAVKFTEKGQIKFGYKIINDKIEFYVRDTGIGISHKNQKIIFERFRQASRSTEKLYGGTGLGLSIAKACANLLGGDIWVESTPGKGSAFYFTIDFKPVLNPQPVNKTVPGKNIRFRGEHILIAEDDLINYQYLSTIFKQHKLKISHTGSGPETLDFILNHPDLKLILLDIQLPEMNGWEIARHLRKINNNVLIVAQTAYAFESDKIESMDVGCNAFLAKPVQEEELMRVIYNLLYTE